MRIPVIKGIIKRRLLVNFRADPAVVCRLLPEPFRPKTHQGYAIVDEWRSASDQSTQQASAQGLA